MSEFQQNGIKFSISEEPIFIGGMDKVTNTSNVNTTNGKYNATKIAAKGKSTPAVNGIDIDWNSAELSYVSLPNVLDNGNTINTTGQLLALINDLQEQINAIVYIMSGGNTGSGDKTTTTSTSSIIPPQSPDLTSTTTVVPGTTTITPVTTLR